jgi:hypothetical protein
LIGAADTIYFGRIGEALWAEEEKMRVKFTGNVTVLIDR